jgi:hypothetical protein
MAESTSCAACFAVSRIRCPAIAPPGILADVDLADRPRAAAHPGGGQVAPLDRRDHGAGLDPQDHGGLGGAHDRRRVWHQQGEPLPGRAASGIAAGHGVALGQQPGKVVPLVVAPVVHPADLGGLGRDPQRRGDHLRAPGVQHDLAGAVHDAGRPLVAGHAAALPLPIHVACWLAVQRATRDGRPVADVPTGGLL